MTIDVFFAIDVFLLIPQWAGWQFVIAIENTRNALVGLSLVQVGIIFKRFLSILLLHFLVWYLQYFISPLFQFVIHN